MTDDMILELQKLRVETITGRVLVDDVDVTLKRGEILGLIGESGAGKSTIGLASMAYARAGMRITGGTITLDGTELRASTALHRRHMRGKSIAYIAQSAAASFNPSMTLMDQVCEAPVVHGVMTRRRPRSTPASCSGRCSCPTPTRSASATRTRSRAASCSASWPPWR